jgi:hypothetical protein
MMMQFWPERPLGAKDLVDTVPSNPRSRIRISHLLGFAHKVEIEPSSPPQLRRGEPRPRSASPIGRSINRGRGWGGVGQENQSIDQRHPGASRHPSSAEEGSLLPRSDFMCKAHLLRSVEIECLYLIEVESVAARSPFRSRDVRTEKFFKFLNNNGLGRNFMGLIAILGL